MSQHVVRRLRPALLAKSARTLRHASNQAIEPPVASNNDYLKRVEHLETVKVRAEWYPRIADVTKAPNVPIREYLHRFEALAQDETKQDVSFSVVGRIQSIRTAGSKLLFVTIAEDEHSVQVVLKHSQLLSGSLKDFASVARKGDTYSFTGRPHRTARGQLSLLATEHPALLAPSLHQIPERLADSETLSHHRHVHMLVDPDVRQTLRVRHAIERTIDDFLCSKDFIKVSTPILQAGAGGATARPFETEATELQGKKLNLRIAPELWLKRLIVGGISRIYELGPVFRNEGVDATHNPEFTMCEFYAAHASLDDLMQWTEKLLVQIHENTASYQKDSRPSFETPFKQLEFIPTLETKLGHALPDLEGPDALEQLKSIFASKDINIPHRPSLPRLLDALAAHYIEPLCDAPTFITHHPTVLSPLAKRFRCPQTKQWVSARAELFIDRCEMANMYEEQNSPFEQRTAFLEQLKHRAIDGESDGKSEIDHAYVEALEWGLPPTGGWGCGIDRLVMLFAGKSRIGHVLSFGGLRNVVGVGNKGK